MADTVPNPYRAAIVSRRNSARPFTEEFTTELDTAVRAMQANAWASTTADTFFTELTGHVSAVNTAAADAIGEFDDAIANQPEEVEPNSWQVHWRNL